MTVQSLYRFSKSNRQRSSLWTGKLQQYPVRKRSGGKCIWDILYKKQTAMVNEWTIHTLFDKTHLYHPFCVEIFYQSQGNYRSLYLFIYFGFFFRKLLKYMSKCLCAVIYIYSVLFHIHRKNIFLVQAAPFHNLFLVGMMSMRVIVNWSISFHLSLKALRLWSSAYWTDSLRLRNHLQTVSSV